MSTFIIINYDQIIYTNDSLVLYAGLKSNITYVTNQTYILHTQKKAQFVGSLYFCPPHQCIPFSRTVSGLVFFGDLRWTAMKISKNQNDMTELYTPED